ncbi:hypothetical protein O3Q52_45440 [Streptomyces sp. ActVer]|uniref:hypothetical protein n=1 Tax=Streptomyces sp. ActVer TaxID=3014558 RepID=UPI0022B43882|nr:hypothetical protein [Streptomyces sp. ActVer]MCZ4515241.1 hypothetical protein [Streptomyces sp. ActVer]
MPRQRDDAPNDYEPNDDGRNNDVLSDDRRGDDLRGDDLRGDGPWSDGEHRKYGDRGDRGGFGEFGQGGEQRDGGPGVSRPEHGRSGGAVGPVGPVVSTGAPVMSTESAGATRSVWDDADSDAAQDSWQESEHPEHTHDPHEVTVQLDGVGRQLEDWLVQQAKGAPSTKEASDGPVFVDETGRRSRRYRRIGMAVGMACAVYAVVILTTLMSGNSSAPWLPELGQEQDDKPAGKVEIPPLPADSAGPSGEVNPSPGVTPSAGGTVSNSPGAGTSTGPSASPTGTGKSADPKPSATNTKPATSPKPSNTGPSNPPPSSPDPEPSVTESSDPSNPPVGGDTDTVAGDPLTPGPVVSPDPSAAPTAQSPENTL